uniref:Secreted protein n=1 Tax=Bursaphelenchus xylophilus TaxID=6326 RepID=A0A1I7RUB3_BURXY
MLKLIGLLAILAMCCHARYNPHTSMPLAPVTPVIGFFPAGLPAVTQLPTRQPITPVTRRRFKRRGTFTLPSQSHKKCKTFWCRIFGP